MRGEHAAESGDLRTYAAEVPVDPRRRSHVDAAPFDRTCPELPIAQHHTGCKAYAASIHGQCFGVPSQAGSGSRATHRACGL